MKNPKITLYPLIAMKKSCVEIIKSYRETDPAYAQLLITVLFNSNFDASVMIMQAEQEGKRLSIKEVPSDLRDEYTSDDIISS